MWGIPLTGDHKIYSLSPTLLPRKNEERVSTSQIIYKEVVYKKLHKIVYVVKNSLWKSAYTN